jgi:dTDP-4-amino-4,6-dideoxygalactose transaminase
MIKDPDQLEKNEGPWYFEMHEVGYNYRITDFQCVLGSSQLKKLDYFVSKRKKISQRYDQAFNLDKRFIIPTISEKLSHAYHLYPLQIDFEKLDIAKNKLFEKMKEKRINLQVHYFPVHMQYFYTKKYGFHKNDFPNTLKFYEREISLPIYPEFELETQEYVINSLINNS